MYVQAVHDKNTTILAASVSGQSDMDLHPGRLQRHVDAATQQTLFERQTAPAPRVQYTDAVRPSVFYPFVGILSGLFVLLGAFFLWRWYRKRARRAAAHENDARARRLSGDIMPLVPLRTPVAPPRTEPPAVYSTLQPQPGSQQQDQPHPTSPPPAHTNPDRPADHDSVLREKRRRANLRRLNALRETAMKNVVERAFRAGAASDDGTEEEVGKKGNENSWALDDAVSRSDDSHFDLIRRGPCVNPEYQARRNERYHQKIAEGFTHEQAMSVSEASTDDSDDPGPFGPRPLPDPSSILRGANLPSSQKAAQPKPQLAPATVPGRWQSLDPDEDILLPSTVYDPSRTAKQTQTEAQQEQLEREEETCLRLPRPNFSRPLGDSSRLSQARIAGTETTATEDEVSTVISDDPWREEVRENRRLGR